MVKKLPKVLLYSGLLILTLIILVVSGYFGYEKYRKVTWTMFDREGDIYLGMSRDDLLFKVDVRLECLRDVDEKKPVFFWRRVDKDRELQIHECDHLGFPISSDGYTRVSNLMTIRLREDQVVWWSSNPLLFSDRFPFDGYDVEEMVSVLGKPDILWISKDLKTRRYTYLEHRTIFRWKNNRLISYNTGDIRWLDTVEVTINGENLMNPKLGPITRLLGKYFVRDTQVCPSSDCPLNDDGSVKERFQGMELKKFVEMKSQ